MAQTDSLIERLKDLPSFTPVLAQISAAVGRSDLSVNQIVDVLKLDTAICSKVLRLANSAYVGVPRTVSSLHNAVVILGQRRIQSLVLAVGTLSAFGQAPRLPFSFISFWRHSMTTALICESIARHLQRYGNVEAGELFCAGVLHDIGKLVLGVLEPQQITAVERDAHARAIPFFKAESDENSHYTIGALLAQRWNFPSDLRNAILYHHEPLHAEPFTKMASIVHLADAMAHLMEYHTFPDEQSPQIDSGAIAHIELQPERLRVIATTAFEDEKKLETLLEFVGM